MDTISVIHSHMRHVIWMLGLLSFALSLVCMLRHTPVTRAAGLSFRAFVWTLTLQLVLGLIQLIVLWSSFGDGLRYRLEHAFVMITAVGISHWALRFVKRPTPASPRNLTAVNAAVIILIVLGILILPQGKHLLGIAG